MHDPVIVTRVREALPDPSIAKAVGRHHTFETAIADLIDNSLDAGAGRVLIRFVESRGAVVGLQVIDDGGGMDGDQLDRAMEFARRRQYGSADQGHFGLGLKAASLSQANRLNVYSRTHGALPAGRTIEADEPTRIGDLDDDHVVTTLSALRIDFPLSQGTVVEWEGPRTFLSSTDTKDRTRWLDGRIGSLRSHLGIVFHRHLASKRFRITIDVFDREIKESGAPRDVLAIDPFGYKALPNDRFPAEMTFAIDGTDHVASAHIWPASQSGLPEFRLGGRPGSLGQGFYFYRNDRLLQAGGWNTLAVDRAEYEYVRIAVELDDALERHVAINPEKAGLELDDDLRQALLHASMGPDRTSLVDFLAVAENRRRESRRYVKRPIAVVPPGRGLSPSMREAFSESVEVAEGGPISIRWQVDAAESPIRLDLENRVIWLNSAYRDLIAGASAEDNEDASLVKTLLMLLFGKYFEGSYLGSREKAELEAWDQLLTAAVRDESEKQAKEWRNHDDER